MNALEQLLWSFDTDDIEEITLASGQWPSGLVGTIQKPLGDDRWEHDALLSALVAFGGSRHVEELSPTPRTWTARVTGLGIISVSATQTGSKVEARFRLSKKADKSIPPPPQAKGSGKVPAQVEPMFTVLTGPPPFDSGRPAALRPPPPPPPPSDPVAPPPMNRARDGRIDTPTQIHERKHQPTLPLWEPVGHSVALDLDVPVPPPPGPFGRAAPPQFPIAVPPPSPGGAPLGPQSPFSPAPSPPPFPPRGHAPPPPPFAVVPRAPPTPAPPPPVFAPPPPPSVPPAPPSSKPAVPSLPPLVHGKGVPAPPPPAPAFDTLLANARDAHASDLHILGGRPPLYRVCGELRPNGPIVSPEQVERMVLPHVPDRLVDVLVSLGSCDFAISTKAHGRFRVNVSRQQTGYKACLRLISKELPTVESLRLPEGIVAGSRHHQGLIVFTGPTGHGKTTTMNAVVDLINRSTSHHVITVEDPVEHVHPKKTALMSQREVGTHTASFASALKGSLREDPDVIVVGELRDVETVRMAIAASETGHLVLGTMNTPSASRTIDRLIDLFPPGDQPQVRLTLAASLRLIVSQRLVPGQGGMHAAMEVLPGSTPLAALIRDNKTFQIPSLQQRGKGLGIVRLDDSLAELVASGRVTMEVAKSVAESPAELETAVKVLRS